MAVLEQIAADTRDVLQTIAKRLERLEDRLLETDAKWEARFVAIDARFSVMEGRLSGMDARLSAVDSRLSGMDSRISAIDSNHRSDFRWLLGIMLGGFASVLGVMAHGFHWL